MLQDSIPQQLGCEKIRSPVSTLRALLIATAFLYKCSFYANLVLFLILQSCISPCSLFCLIGRSLGVSLLATSNISFSRNPHTNIPCCLPTSHCANTKTKSVYTFLVTSITLCVTWQSVSALFTELQYVTQDAFIEWPFLVCCCGSNRRWVVTWEDVRRSTEACFTDFVEFSCSFSYLSY